MLAAIVVGFVSRKGFTPAAENLDKLWERAEQDLSAGRFANVEKAIETLARSRPPTPLDWFLRGQLALARKEDDQAIDCLARVPDDHFMAAQARLLAGQTELRRDRVRLAETLFHAALAIDPRLIQAHRELIYIYGMQLRRAELSSEFMALSRLTDLNFDNAFHWGLLRNNSWEPGTAVDSLTAFAAADPLDRWSRLALAENYRRMGRLDDADSAIKPLADDDTEAIGLRAKLALERLDPDRAERLLATGPHDDPVLARLRGTLALGQRDVARAIESFRIAYTADPENREALFGYIAALELAHDDKTAEPLRDRARRFDRLISLIQRAAVGSARLDASLLKQLGEACVDLDRKDEARAWYKLAIGLDPLDATAQQALFRLNDRDATKPPTVPKPSGS